MFCISLLFQNNIIILYFWIIESINIDHNDEDNLGYDDDAIEIAQLWEYPNIERLKYLVRNSPDAGGEESVNKESSDQQMQKLLNMLHGYFCNANHNHHRDPDDLDQDNSVDFNEEDDVDDDKESKS